MAEKRERIARGMDGQFLHWLAAEVKPGSTSSLEFVFADGQRVRLARGGNAADLHALVASAEAEGGRIELVRRRIRRE